MTTYNELAIRQEISVARRAIDHALKVLDRTPPVEIGAETFQQLNSLLAEADGLLGALMPLADEGVYTRMRSSDEPDQLSSRSTP